MKIDINCFFFYFYKYIFLLFINNFEPYRNELIKIKKNEYNIYLKFGNLVKNIITVMFTMR